MIWKKALIKQLITLKTSLKTAPRLETLYRELKIKSRKTEATISPEKGALVTSFKINKKETLYIDRDSFCDEKNKKPRMGIPILAPYSGIFNNSDVQHGGARELPWNLVNEEKSSVLLELDSSVATKAIKKSWAKTYGDNFAFNIKLGISVSENTLKYSICIENKSSTKKVFSPGLHPYFRIGQKIRKKTQSNIAGFDLLKMNEKNALYYKVNATEIWFGLPGMKITYVVDSRFKYFAAWGEDGKNNLCLEPLTSYSNKTEDFISLKPGEHTCLSVAIKIEID